MNSYRKWNVFLLEDEGLAEEIHLHLQGIGKDVRAMDIVHFLGTPEMLKWLDRTKSIAKNVDSS
jgi:hypothetical protein